MGGSFTRESQRKSEEGAQRYQRTSRHSVSESSYRTFDTDFGGSRRVCSLLSHRSRSISRDDLDLDLVTQLAPVSPYDAAEQFVDHH